MGEAKRRKSLNPNYGKPNPDLDEILTNEEIEKIMLVLMTAHDRITEDMLAKACSEFRSMKLQGLLFELAMKDEIDFAINHKGNLAFGIMKDNTIKTSH